jgi:hypothetical protein
MPIGFIARDRLQRRGLACPETMPFAPFAARRSRCLLNHAQSPETLAARGGLGAFEALAILEDKHYLDLEKEMPKEHDWDEAALPRLLTLLAALEMAKLEAPPRQDDTVKLSPTDATGAGARAERALWDEAIEYARERVARAAAPETKAVLDVLGWVVERVRQQRGA